MQFLRRENVPHDKIIDDLGDMRVIHDAARDEELTESIKDIGVQDPIRLRPHPSRIGFYQLVDGRRRRRCNEAAGNDVIVSDIYEMTKKEALLSALVSNIQRDDPDPVGVGFWLEKIQKEDPMIKSQEDLALAVHRSQSWISRMISAYKQAIMNAGEEMEKETLSIEDLKASAPTERHARVLRSVSDEVAQRVIDMTNIIGEPPSARSIERIAKAKKTPREVLERYDPLSSMSDVQFIGYQLIEDAGLLATEAIRMVNDWKAGKLSWQKKQKLILEPAPGDKTVEMYRKLSEIYPTELIDIVEKVVPAKTYETMAKYCRRFIRSLIIHAPEDLRQTVLEDFRGI